MALPASGPISFNAINVELGVAGTTQANINQASYRGLAGVASGTISLSNFYGKSNVFAFQIGSNQTNLNLRTLALANGWNGTAAVIATVNGGVYIYSTDIGTPGLTINGSFPNGVSLVNNGFILGKGGRGAQPGATSWLAGETGGPAISLGVSVSITNNSYIAGGGGGGGGSSSVGGGGAGGGNGGSHYDRTINGPGGGGSGGGPGSAGNNAGPEVTEPNGTYDYWVYTGGGGGGRILPGTGGNQSAGGGAGGGGGFFLSYVFYDYYTYYYGQDGGSANAAGFTAAGDQGGAGGGGWGASGGGGISAGGGAGGKAVALNGYTATFVANGIRYGAIS